jgi:hypothetical protein
MEMNSLGTILLFAIKNGARELHIRKNELPVIINSEGSKLKLRGINPITKTTFEDICLKYLNVKEHIIKTIGSDDFLIFKLEEIIIFRHLPKVEALDESLSTSFLNKKGLILIVSKSQDLRIKNAYSTLETILNLRTMNTLVLEREKYYSIKENKKKNLLPIYKPNLDLDLSIGMIGQINFECLFIPNLEATSVIKTVENISDQKLVIIGIKPENIYLFKKEYINSIININEDGTLSCKVDQSPKVNESVIIRNLRGEKHA